MTKRLALTPAVGLFAGLSVVSYGAVSMMLTGVHGTRQASSNPCTAAAPASPTPTPSTKALIRPAAHTGARAQHPAGMPVLLAYAVHLGKHTGTQAPAVQGSVAAQGNQAAGSASASQTQTASQSTAPLPGSQPSPSASPPPLPQPSPGSSVGPAPGGLPEPAPAKSSAKQLTPGGTLKSPIATPTVTPTTTATPTTTPTTSPPPGTLCLKIQTLNGVSAVDPHTTVGYAIWVWLTSGSGTAKVTLSAKPSSLSPAFSVCASTGTSKCSVSLNAGQQPELQAKLAAPDRPTKRFILTATATSSQASNSATASATVDIKPKNPSPTSSPTPGAGDGGTLPPVAGLPSGTTIPGVGAPAPTGDLGSAFPQVSPSPAAAAPAASQHGHETRAIDLSAGLPLDVRLIGGQVIGLAVLAAAVTIAVARMSLRRQPAKHGEDSPGS
jgi:hypothetical protein